MTDPSGPSIQRRLPVLIAETRKDMLGAILEDAVAGHDGMTLLDRVQINRAEAALKRQRGRCTLLLVAERGTHRTTAARFVSRHADLVVIRIDIPTAEVTITLRRIGLDQLLRTMCSLGQADASERESHHWPSTGGGHA